MGLRQTLIAVLPGDLAGMRLQGFGETQQYRELHGCICAEAVFFLEIQRACEYSGGAGAAPTIFMADGSLAATGGVLVTCRYPATGAALACSAPTGHACAFSFPKSTGDGIKLWFVFGRR